MAVTLSHGTAATMAGSTRLVALIPFLTSPLPSSGAGFRVPLRLAHPPFACAAEAAALLPADDEADCRICLEREKISELVAPCGCTGSMRYAHKECLERWCQEKGSGCCEVCGCQYNDVDMIQRLRRRQLEQRRRELMEWPEHGISPDELLIPPPQRVITAQPARKLMLMSLVFMTFVLVFLTQSIDHERSVTDLEPRELDISLARTRRYAQPSAIEKQMAARMKGPITSTLWDETRPSVASKQPAASWEMGKPPSLWDETRPSSLWDETRGPSPDVAIDEAAARLTHTAASSQSTPASAGTQPAEDSVGGGGSGGAGAVPREAGGLAAPPSPSLAVGALAVEGGARRGQILGRVEAARAYGSYLTQIATATEIGLLTTAARKGCGGASAGGVVGETVGVIVDGSPDSVACKRGELVLRILRQRRALQRVSRRWIQICARDLSLPLPAASRSPPPPAPRRLPLPAASHSPPPPTPGRPRMRRRQRNTQCRAWHALS